LYIFISHGIIYETKSGIVLAFIYLKNIMKLFDKIKNFLSGGQSSNYLWEGKGMGDAKTRDLYNAYNESYVVYACLDKIQKKIELKPALLESFDLKAKRPKFSAMSNSKIQEQAGYAISSWQEATDRFIIKYLT